MEARRPLTDTERNWFYAFGLVVGCVLVCWAIQAAEVAWGHAELDQRMVGHPVETAMRFVALPHFLIAIAFMATSRGMRRVRPWLWFAGLLAVSTLLCLAFYAAGGRHAAIPRILFLAYFAIHASRDDVFFYKANGDAQADGDSGRFQWSMLVPAAMVVFTILAIGFFGTAFEIGGLRKYTGGVFGSLPEQARWALGGLSLVVLLFTVGVYFKRYRAGILAAHRPMCVVFGGTLVIVLLDILVSGRIHSIVTLHVTAWFVFAMHQYSKRPAPNPAPPRLRWTWMRTTRGGFAFLHIGLVVLVMIAAAVWAYGFRNAPSQKTLSAFLSRDAFPVWTIIHVTISFAPR